MFLLDKLKKRASKNLRIPDGKNINAVIFRVDSYKLNPISFTIKIEASVILIETITYG